MTKKAKKLTKDQKYKNLQESSEKAIDKANQKIYYEYVKRLGGELINIRNSIFLLLLYILAGGQMFLVPMPWVIRVILIFIYVFALVDSIKNILSSKIQYNTVQYKLENFEDERIEIEKE